MTARRAIALVARREVLERTRERSFLIGTAVTLAILAAIVLLPTLFGGSGDDDVLVAAAGPQAARVAGAARALDQDFDVRVLVRRVASDAEARRLVRDGAVEAAVLDRGRALLRRGGTPDGAIAALQAGSASRRALEALRRSGADPADAQRILRPPPLTERTLDAGADDRKGFALVALIVLYGQLITFGIWVAVGIVEEKASRIVEILLATIRPRELLAGKVLGIGLVGILQLLLIGAVGLGIGAASGQVDVGAAELSALPVLIAWFVLGYALYACAFAVVGALVPRQEDVQSSAMPVVLALLASLFLSFNAIDDPGGSPARVLTFVPFSSPLVVPVRLIVGDIPAWEVVVSVLVLLAAIAALVLLAGRIYGNAVLRTGGRVRLRDALAARRA